MIKYQVQENGKPARYPFFRVHQSWNCCDFDSLEDARKYAANWLGPFNPDFQLSLSIPYCYNGEDFVQIVVLP